MSPDNHSLPSVNSSERGSGKTRVGGGPLGRFGVGTGALSTSSIVSFGSSRSPSNTDPLGLLGPWPPLLHSCFLLCHRRRWGGWCDLTLTAGWPSGCAACAALGFDGTPFIRRSNCLLYQLLSTSRLRSVRLDESRPSARHPPLTSHSTLPVSMRSRTWRRWDRVASR